MTFELLQERRMIVGYTLEELSAKIKKEPNNSELYALRAERFYDAEKYEEALTDCNTAMNLELNAANTYKIRGQVYWKLKRYKEAISDCNKAIKIQPNFAEAYNYRGNTIVILVDMMKL